jgi:hypothetical protein
MSGTYECAGVATGDDGGNGLLDPLESLPVAPCGKSISTLTIGTVAFRIPCTGPNPFDELRCHDVSLDGKGVIGIVRIDVVDETEIPFAIFRKSRWQLKSL